MKRSLIIAVFLASQVFLFACAGSFAVYECDRYYNKGEYEKAIACYKETLNKSSKKAIIYNDMGVSYSSQGDYNKAIVCFNNAIENDNKYYRAFYNRGQCNKELGDYDHAIEDYRHVLELRPSLAYDVYYQIGYALAKKGNLAEAIKEYSQALSVKKAADSFNNRGVCYFDLGEYDLAINDFNKTIELDGRYYSAYVYRGRACTKKGLYDRAIEDNTTALKLLASEGTNVRFPDWNPHATMLKDRGLNYYYQGKYDQSIADYEQAMRYSQDDAEILFFRGNAWMHKCVMDRAIHDFTMAIKLQPNYAQAYRSLALILASSPDCKYRNGEEALRLARKAVELENTPASQEALAAANAEKGDFTEAARVQGIAISMIKDKPTSTYMEEAQRRLQLFQTNAPLRLTVSCQ